MNGASEDAPASKTEACRPLIQALQDGEQGLRRGFEPKDASPLISQQQILTLLAPLQAA